MPNDYNTLADSYTHTDVKPDKQFSILPTVLHIAGDVTGRTVLDLGCGSGFFTRAFGGSAKHVIGMDNAEKQIDIARQSSEQNVEYVLGDIMEDDLPSCDIVHAPFVLGYCSDVDQLRHLLRRAYAALTTGGRFVGVVDLPSGADLRKFGATKILHDEGDGAKIEIVLNDRGTPICTLWATYFAIDTIAAALYDVGFLDVTWHAPIISKEGLSAMPQGFWDGYVENSELGYVTATK